MSNNKQYTITESDLIELASLLLGEKVASEEVEVYTQGNSLQLNFEGWNMEFFEVER